MPNTSLVTGANGHLGNNLIRLLMTKGDRVIAGIRNPQHRNVLSSLGCPIVHADLMDKPSLVKALANVDVLYQVGAVFKHWAHNPQRDIYDANMLATRNAIEAASEAGVSKILYVSSLGALDRSQTPITETTWNPDTLNVYFRSKTDSEKLAWELADKLGLTMVSVLPGAMIGPNCFSMTPTMALFQTILDGKLSANPGFFFNFVDIRDVAVGCWLAVAKGKAGERYLLANEKCTGIDEIVRVAQQLYPQRKIKMPPKPPKPLLYLIVSLMELGSKVLRNEPQLQRNYLSVFSAKEQCDISKARGGLGFNPQPPYRAIETTLRYLAEDHANNVQPIDSPRQ
jgi:dihydroflavonol-4-reductase